MTVVPTSWLFVPGNRPDRFDKAFAAGAGVVILDLEDAVAEADKAEARNHVLARLAQKDGPQKVLRAVRVNSLFRASGLLDLAALADAGAAGPDFIVLPKVEHPETVRLAARVLSDRGSGARLVALIESARGVAMAADIADAGPGLVALMFGAADYSADLGQSVGHWRPDHARAVVANAAASGGLAAVDSPFFNLQDAVELSLDCEAARRLGFTAKAAIHPDQIQAIGDIFEWAEADRDRARRILEAAPDGVGVLDGRMVDAAMMRWAQRVLT